jgi:hypothetical protein
MTSSADSVRQAVLALYRGDQAQQGIANSWLIAFQQSPEAWQTAHALVNKDEPPEIQFFAASLLVRKVRAEFYSTDPALQCQLQGAFASIFQDALTWPGASPLVLRQLCLLQAATMSTPPVVAVGEGGNNIGNSNDLLDKALALLHINPSIALELLTAIAEETDDLQARRRTAIVTVLLSTSPQVYNAMAALLMQSLQQAQHVAAAQTLRAVLAWVQLSPHASGGGGSGGSGQLNPADFNTRQPLLFQAVLAALATDSSSGDVAAGAAAVLLALLASSKFGPEEDHDAVALNAIISALLSIRPYLQTVNEHMALAIGQVGAAVAERWPEGVCGLLPESLDLANLMLECLNRPEPMITESTLDFFFMVNTVPLSQRPLALGPPLFETMMIKLQRHIAYPEDFPVHGWAEDTSEIDPEAFSRMRDAVLPEVLQETYGLLRVRYLIWAWDELQKATTWQHAETAMYYIGAVALSARARGLAGPEIVREVAVAEDAAATRNVLCEIFTYICCNSNSLIPAHSSLNGATISISSGLFMNTSIETAITNTPATSLILTTHSALACTACWLIEQYAVWFGKAEEAPAHSALETTLSLLDMPGTATTAAKAFNAMCLRCSTRLRNPTTVLGLLKPVHAVLLRGHLPLEDEVLLVEGMAHVTAGLSSDQAEAAATHLTKPFVQDLQTAAGEQSPLNPASVKRVIRALHLVAAALKSFLSAALSSGASASSGGPAVGVLHSMSDALDTISRSPQWQRDSEVMSAVVEVYKRAVCSARRRSLELLPAVMPAVGAVFAATALPLCLDVLAEAVEIHFQDLHIVEQLLSGISAACEAAFPALQGNGLRERGALAAALLGLTDSFAVYAPAALWPSPLLSPLLELAIATVATAREIEPSTRALSVIGHVVSIQEKAVGDFGGPGISQSHIDAVHAVLISHGQSMVDALLRGLCDTCPRQSMRTAGDRLRSLLTHPILVASGSNGGQGQGVGFWLQSVVMSGQLPGCAEGLLSQETCLKFCSLVLRGNLRAARLTGLIVDFGLIARREETADVLLAYEL